MGATALNPHDAAALCDDIEARVFADLFDAAPQPLREKLGLRVATVADATLLLAPGMPTSMFNRAIGLGLKHKARVADVREIVKIYTQAGSSPWWLHWNPEAAPADFTKELLRIGFTQPARKSWAKVLRGPAPAPRIHTDLHISPVANEDQAEQAAQAVTRSFEMPAFMAQWFRQLHGRDRWRMYLVQSEDEQVVGGGCLYVESRTAWLGMGSVLPTHRRRGGQGALMARRIADAIEAGCEHLATETGEAMADEPNPSLANMKRCGFETVASRLNFAAPN